MEAPFQFPEDMGLEIRFQILLEYFNDDFFRAFLLLFTQTFSIQNYPCLLSQDPSSTWVHELPVRVSDYMRVYNEIIKFQGAYVEISNIYEKYLEQKAQSGTLLRDRFNIILFLPTFFDNFFIILKNITYYNFAFHQVEITLLIFNRAPFLNNLIQYNIESTFNLMLWPSYNQFRSQSMFTFCQIVEFLKQTSIFMNALQNGLEINISDIYNRSSTLSERDFLNRQFLIKNNWTNSIEFFQLYTTLLKTPQTAVAIHGFINQFQIEYSEVVAGLSETVDVEFLLRRINRMRSLSNLGQMSTNLIQDSHHFNANDTNLLLDRIHNRVNTLQQRQSELANITHHYNLRPRP